MARYYSRTPAKKIRRFPIIILTVAVMVGGVYLLSKTVLNTTGDSHAQQLTPIHVKPKYTKAQTICLDPGHGGDDPGAVNNDLTERDINLIVANDVDLLLEKDGYQVFMTRTTNNDTLSNNDRYTFCNSKNATIMVSIHHNFFDDKTVDYATALYYKDSDQSLAQSILNAVSTKLNVTNDGISQFEDGVLSKSIMPAALSEGFFVTNTDEYNVIMDPNSTRLNDEAQGIVQGIISYFTNPTPPQLNLSTNPTVVRNDE